MANRCGDLDPGVLLYLLRERRLSADAHAAEAADLFCSLVRMRLGALSAALGEHSADVRAAICADQVYLGVALDRCATRQTPP